MQLSLGSCPGVGAQPSNGSTHSKAARLAVKGLTDLLAGVSCAVQAKGTGARERVLETAKLPQAAAARERIVNDLVERALDGDGVAKALRELQSLLELALETSAVVHVDGD